MTILSLIRKDRDTAQSASFRSKYGGVGPGKQLTFPNQDAAVAHFASGPKQATILYDGRESGQGERLKRLVPDVFHGHYDKVRENLRFKKFALFTKGGEGDGLVLGFDINGACIVLAIWDKEGKDMWEPSDDR